GRVRPGAGVAWEDVVCPLCGARDEELLIAAAPEPDQPLYRVVQCRACGMGYLNPRPNSASLGQFYPDDYECYQTPQPAHPGPWQRLRHYLERLALSHYCGYPPPCDRWHERLLAALARPLLRRARQSLTGLPFRGEGRMLDFGCGGGWYAERMQRQGWSVVGLDFSDHAAAAAARRYGLTVHVGTLPHTDVAPGSFDLITMGCVLEHVPEPHRVIAAAAEALR